ncbi:MAG: YkgJ family cysteine cluster protein [Rhodospirillaceae bacterium]|nr:YkgJ family cysteine cluster protein [Rhodospirillaceae bacterium]
MSDSQGDAHGNTPGSLSRQEQALERQVFAHFFDRVKRALEDAAHAPSTHARRGVLAKAHYDISTALSTNTNTVLNTPAGAGVKKEIACRKGCTYCCYQNVGVTAIEAIAIASGIMLLKPHLAPRIAAEVDQIQGMTDGARAAQRKPCVFLSDGLCSIHDIRPLACRAYFSLNLKDCEEVFEKGLSPGAEGNITTFSFPAIFRTAVLAATNAASAERGLQNGSIELTAAVARVLADPAIVDRWFAGEDVFTPHQA